MKGIGSMSKKPLLVSLILFMIFGIVHLASAQVKEINVGKIHMTINQKFDWVCWTEGEWSLTYPGGWYHREQLVGTEYKGAQDSLEYYTATGTDFYPPDAGIWTTAYTGYSFTVEEMKEFRKYDPPTVIVDDIPQRPFVGEVDPDLPCDQMLYWVNQTGRWVWCGAQHKIKVYAFTNPAFDDFIIFDYTVINNLDWDITQEGPDGPDQTIRIWFTKDLTPEPIRRSYGGDGLYPYSYSHGTAYGYDTWNDYIIRQSELVPPATPGRDSLLIQYGVDANAPDDWDPVAFLGGPFDDFADPYPIADEEDAGKLLAPCYTGFCTFLLDREYNGTDDPTQPFLSGSFDIVTELWSGPLWPHGEATGWDYFTNPLEPHRYDPSDPTDTYLYAGDNPWTIDPAVDHSDVLGRTMIQIHGPIDIPAGDSIHWVWAIGVGSIRADSAITLGKSWFNGDVTDLERNLIVAQGYDSLFHNLDKAYAAWISYFNTGDFNIPDAPPSPDLKVTSGPGYISLEWGYPDPAMMPANFDEWRVYRKEGHYLVDHRDDIVYKDYELITTITDENTTDFEDNTVVRGQEYHYFVTCVADGIEGSKYDNRSLYGATSFEPGISSTLDSVRIVPNPYRIDAGNLNFTDPNKIAFFGLPPYCTLKIYNEFGDLIKIIEHTSGSADESWDQITESNQYVAPGIYILSIEDAEDLEGNSLGTKTYKFIILR